MKSKISYSKVSVKGIVISCASLQLKAEKSTGKYVFSVVGAGMTKVEAQINLHEQLQDIYELIGDEIEHLRDVM